MNKRIPLFQQLEIETSSTCNRTCDSCLRNSHPDRDKVKSWFEQNLLPTETIEAALGQAIALGFRGPLCFQHYNEPLQDPRIAELGRFAKKLPFSQVFICSNADLLDDEKIKEIDGVFDVIQIALYNMNELQQAKREQWLLERFVKTGLYFTKGIHIPTHFSPRFDVKALARSFLFNPCYQPQVRMIINHKGQMLMCCDDLVGNFDLGIFPLMSLEELWFSDRHQEMMLTLQQPGGRTVYPYCASCPRA